MACVRFTISGLTSLILVLALGQAAFVQGNDEDGNWPRFRGPNGTGHLDSAKIPFEWSDETNLRWKTELPGKGSSSPIVVGDRIYLTCYTGYGLEQSNPGDPTELVRHLLAFDRASGKELWRKSVGAEKDVDPYKGFITQHGYASSTPVSDGEHVFVLFDKLGLFAYDREGNLVWERNLGTKSDPAKWGSGSSPILYENMVIANAGILGNQLVALDKETGDVVWSRENDSYTNCWSTPILVESDSAVELVCQVPNQVMGLNPKTGEQLWQAETPLPDSTCGSVVALDGNAYMMGSREGAAIGVACFGEGDVSESNTLWQTRLRSGITTPVIVNKSMYWTSGGIFYAASLETGKEIFKARLPRKGAAAGGFGNADYASPVAVGDKIIVFTRNGESYVIQAGDEFSLVSHNAAFSGDDSAFSGTPAIVSDGMFVRSEKYLYSIGKTE